MKIFGINFGKRANKVFSENGDVVWGMGGMNSSGEVVDAESSMRVSAVYSSVKVLTETIASLPCVLYRKLEEGRTPATEHPLFSILHDQPNDSVDSADFFQAMQGDLCLRGNGYAVIDFSRFGDVIGLHRVHPDVVNIVKSKDGYVYEVVDWQTGTKTIYPKDRMFHIRGMIQNGVKGISPIDYMREQVGAAIAMDKHNGKFFSNGVRTTGILKYPGKIDPKKLLELRESFEKQYKGSDNANKTLILEQGMEYAPVSMTNEQSQFIQSSKMKRSEIAGMFRVPPHLIGDLEHGSFSNIEQMSLEFITYTMLPWFVKWEQAIKRCLMTKEEQKKYKAEFLADAVLRGDGLTRAQKFQIERQMGVLSADEWRAMENRNPLPNNAGKQFLVPMNMQEAGTHNENNHTGAEPPTTPGKKAPTVPDETIVKQPES